MQQILKLLGRPLAFLAQLRAANRQAFNLIAGALAVGAALLGTLYVLNPGAPEILAANLSAADRTVLALMLRRRAIPFTLGADSISVPARSFDRAEQVLTASPSFAGGNDGFSLFDHNGFGQSDFDQQVAYQRALQGELERTIMQIRGIESARVMLAMGRPSPFALGDGDTAHASVMITTSPGATLDISTARAIAHLVANSVRGLSAANVTVSNENGTILYPSESNGRLDEAIRLRNELEHRLEGKVSALLNRIMGKNRYAVEVSVAVDTSRITTKQQIYGNSPKAAVLSEEHSVSPAALGDMAAGIPGLTSNLPVPTPKPTPTTDGAAPNGSKPKGAALSSVQESGSRVARKDIVNYKPSSREVASVSSPIRIKRISVAAVLDGTYDDGRFTPLPKERLAEIKDLLATAVGAQPGRGDSIDVQCAALSQPYVPPVPSPVTELRSLFSNPLQLYGAIGAGVLLALVLLWLGVRMMKRLLFKRPPEQVTVFEQPALPAQAQIFDTADAAGARGQSETAPAPPTQSEALAELRARVNAAVERNPEAATEILRRWLAHTNGNGSNAQSHAEETGEA